MLRAILVGALLTLVVPATAAAIPAADDREPTVRGKKAPEWLEMLQKDPNADRRRAAVIALGILGPKVPGVVLGLSDALKGRRQVGMPTAWPDAFTKLSESKSAEVRSQATALAVVAVAVGVPGGVALGRWTWRLVADNVGSVSPAIVPLGAVLLVVPATLVVANLLAGGPAWAAGRVRPSEALRVE